MAWNKSRGTGNRLRLLLILLAEGSSLGNIKLHDHLSCGARERMEHQYSGNRGTLRDGVRFGDISEFTLAYYGHDGHESYNDNRHTAARNA